MEHSVLPSKQQIVWYIVAWSIIAVLHVAIISLLGIFSLFPVIIDSLISTYLFALLGVPVWYVVQFYKPEKATIFNLLINHITLGVAVIAGWFFTSTYLIKIATSHWTSYQTFQMPAQPLRVIYGIFLYLILTLIYYLIIYYNNLQDKVKSEARLQEMIKEVELDMLKSQINPHFLFNSLNSISSLTITAPEMAREMLVKLSDYLRYSVSMGKSQITTLGEEIENIKLYLEIEKIRFGSKLLFSFDLQEDILDATIPAMILQPLYENAVKHGVYESTSEIVIKTSAWLQGSILTLRITNNYEPGVPSKKGAGVGLKNISERLRLLYHNEQLLQAKKHDQLFEVIVSIPQVTQV